MPSCPWAAPLTSGGGGNWAPASSFLVSRPPLPCAALAHLLPRLVCRSRSPAGIADKKESKSRVRRPPPISHLPSLTRRCTRSCLVCCGGGGGGLAGLAPCQRARHARRRFNSTRHRGVPTLPLYLLFVTPLTAVPPIPAGQRSRFAQAVSCRILAARVVAAAYPLCPGLEP